MGIAIGLGLIACIVPGILLMLMWWPAYYLVVDEKAGVMESFSVAGNITRGNWGAAILLWLISLAVSMAGVLALCIGILFAAPFVAMMWAVAYLMMSGQINRPVPASNTGRANY